MKSYCNPSENLFACILFLDKCASLHLNNSLNAPALCNVLMFSLRVSRDLEDLPELL